MKIIRKYYFYEGNCDVRDKNAERWEEKYMDIDLKMENQYMLTLQ